MARNLLLRGMLAGVLAGLLAFGFAALVGESPLEMAIGFETMDSRAACRTYNVLLAEGRRVVAALLFAAHDEAPR